MTANKDFKRLVRARMRKTGEAYTTARRHIVDKPKPIDWVKLTGFKDATVKAKTGCTWDSWVKALDYAGADKWGHGKITTYIVDKWKVDGWWAQLVTVGYERIKGLREIGQRLDGSYEASKTKVYAVPLAKVYRAWADVKARRRWLPDAFTVTTATRNKSLRIKWPDGTNVAVYFYKTAAGKTQVNVQHAKLDKAGLIKMRAFWASRLGELAVSLGQ